MIDPVVARVAFRARSVSDVLDLALRFATVHRRIYARVALITLVPLALLTLAAGLALGGITTWAVAIPLSVLAEIPFTILASRLVFDDHVHARDVARAALREAPRVFVARLSGLLLTVFGLIILVVPGLWLATSFLFLTEVMLLERGGPLQSFGRSQRVTSSATSEVVAGLLVLGLVPVASVLLMDVAGRALIGELLQFRPPPAVWSEGASTLATIGLFAQVPYTATARFLLYLDVRTRVEGWDIQTRFAAIAARGA